MPIFWGFSNFFRFWLNQNNNQQFLSNFLILLSSQGPHFNSENITVVREHLVWTIKNVKRMSQMSKKLLIMLGQHAMMQLYKNFAQLSRPFWTNSKVIWHTMVWLLQRIFNGDDYDHCSYRLTNLKSSGAFSAKIFFMGYKVQIMFSYYWTC